MSNLLLLGSVRRCVNNITTTPIRPEDVKPEPTEFFEQEEVKRKLLTWKNVALQFEVTSPENIEEEVNAQRDSFVFKASLS